MSGSTDVLLERARLLMVILFLICRDAVIAAKMARELLFEQQHSLAPESYVDVSQT